MVTIEMILNEVRDFGFKDDVKILEYFLTHPVSKTEITYPGEMTGKYDTDQQWLDSWISSYTFLKDGIW